MEWNISEMDGPCLPETIQFRKPRCMCATPRAQQSCCLLLVLLKSMPWPGVFRDEALGRPRWKVKLNIPRLWSWTLHKGSEGRSNWMETDQATVKISVTSSVYTKKSDAKSPCDLPEDPSGAKKPWTAWFPWIQMHQLNLPSMNHTKISEHTPWDRATGFYMDNVTRMK